MGQSGSNICDMRVYLFKQIHKALDELDALADKMLKDSEEEYKEDS